MKFFNFIQQFFSDNSQTNNLSSLAFANSPVASFISDENGKFIDVNHNFSKLTGYTNEDVVGESLSLLKSGKHNNQFYKNLWIKATELDSYSFEIYNRCKNSKILLILENVAKIIENGKTYFLVTQEDITDKKKLEDRQQHLATHDPLTNLANRTLLNDRFSQAVFHAKRKHNKIALFLCDLNEFKDVNDSYGHIFGDKVLKAVADNLKHLVREGDTVARYGGDEFVIIIEQLRTNNEIMKILQKIKEKSNITVKEDICKCDVSMSIGHAIFPSDGVELKHLMNIADTQMYERKKEYYGY